VFYFKTKKREKMQAVCPITDKRIDERVARVNGLITFALITVFVVFQLWVLLAFLVVDFAIRGLIDSKYSIMCWFSKRLVNQFSNKPKLINAGPKIFAAQVGLMLSVLALGLYFVNCNYACIAIASILGFFSFLEGAFGFCVACKLYPLIRNINL
jgi:hypothetical protein